MSILAFAEQRGGAFKKAAYETVSTAVKLAADLNTQAVGIVVGSGVEGIAAELGKYGVSKVIVVDDPVLTNYSTEAYAQALEEAIKKDNAKILLMPATAMGRDLSARVAARFKAGLASDVTHMDVAGGKLTITRPIFAGKAFQKISITSDQQVITLRPNVFKARETGGSATVEKIAVSFKPVRARVKDTVVESGKKIELTEAEIIVSGGRGLKGPENWNLIGELASALGAAQGASRAVVDAGWRPHEEQVGQTGKTVSPTLYVAVGISGAIQHLAGMSTSKCIVAINKDREAPIFKVADYGIVGDLFEVVPRLTAEVKKLKG